MQPVEARPRFAISARTLVEKTDCCCCSRRASDRVRGVRSRDRVEGPRWSPSDRRPLVAPRSAWMTVGGWSERRLSDGSGRGHVSALVRARWRVGSRCSRRGSRPWPSSWNGRTRVPSPTRSSAAWCRRPPILARSCYRPRSCRGWVGVVLLCRVHAPGRGNRAAVADGRTAARRRGTGRIARAQTPAHRTSCWSSPTTSGSTRSRCSTSRSLAEDGMTLRRASS